MQVFPSFENLTQADQYMFAQMFSQAEIEAGGWFIMNLYDRRVLVNLVQHMGGDAHIWCAAIVTLRTPFSTPLWPKKA